MFGYISECPTLTSISNGNVDLALGHWEGSIATYVCQNDYALVGSPVRKCLSTGQWTGVEPSCIIGKNVGSISFSAQFIEIIPIIKRLAITLIYYNRLRAWWSTQSRLATLLSSLIARWCVGLQTL